MSEIFEEYKQLCKELNEFEENKIGSIPKFV